MTCNIQKVRGQTHCDIIKFSGHSSTLDLTASGNAGLDLSLRCSNINIVVHQTPMSESGDTGATGIQYLDRNLYWSVVNRRGRAELVFWSFKVSVGRWPARGSVSEPGCDQNCSSSFRRRWWTTAARSTRPSCPAPPAPSAAPVGVSTKTWCPWVSPAGAREASARRQQDAHNDAIFLFFLQPTTTR